MLPLCRWGQPMATLHCTVRAGAADIQARAAAALGGLGNVHAGKRGVCGCCSATTNAGQFLDESGMMT